MKNAKQVRTLGQFVEFKDESGDWIIGKLISDRTKYEGRLGYHINGVLGGKYFIHGKVRDVRMPEIKGARSLNHMQFPFHNVSDNELREALISVGFSGSSAAWTSRMQRITILRAMGFNGIETKAPSAAPDGTTARPCVMIEAAPYLANFGIGAIQCWATDNEIYLKVDDSKTLNKLKTAGFGAPKKSNEPCGEVFTFKTPHGAIRATKVQGTRGKQFVVRLVNA